ncbi:MAG TPA: transglutaminase family protein [Terracidiphilus sp.]|nr:transglutaminase family protein [Terracidiphilus sp.]
MLIRVGYEIEFEFQNETPMLAMLHVSPSRSLDLVEPDELEISPAIPMALYIDDFGNRCTRFVAPRGRLRLSCSALVLDSGQPDPVNLSARERPVDDLPPETLMFLLSSRYCEVDRFGEIAHDLFGDTAPGWSRVQAICDWVHEKVRFDYAGARPTKTALDVFTERVGVCRDFQHLAITLCRAMNIPARYATGYLGDIGVPPGGPMDFSAWFEVYLENRWWTFDARHNTPRIGRVLMAVGRDAADVALTTSFGQAELKKFFVVTEEESKRPTLVTGANEPLALAG